MPNCLVSIDRSTRHGSLLSTATLYSSRYCSSCCDTTFLSDSTRP